MVRIDETKINLSRLRFATKYKVYCKSFNKSSDEMLTESCVLPSCCPDPFKAFKASFCEIVYRPPDREREKRTR